MDKKERERLLREAKKRQAKGGNKPSDKPADRRSAFADLFKKEAPVEKPALPEKSKESQFILELIASEEEKILNRRLVDCVYGEANDVVRNFLTLREIISDWSASVVEDKNEEIKQKAAEAGTTPELLPVPERFKLTKELRSIVESKGEITAEQKAQAGWDETLSLIGGMYPDVYAIGELREKRQKAEKESEIAELSQQIYDMQREKIATPIATYYWKNKKYPPGSTLESLIDKYTAIADNFELIVTKCFDEGEHSGHRFVEAVRKRVFGEPAAEGDYKLEQTGLEAGLANALKSTAEEIGWAQAAPMNRIYTQLSMGLKQWDEFEGKSGVINSYEERGDTATANKKKEEAIHAHMSAYEHFKAALEALHDPRVTEIAGNTDIAAGSVTLTDRTIPNCIETAKNIDRILHESSLEYANKRTADAFKEIPRNDDDRNYAVYLNNQLISVLMDAKRVEGDLERFIETAQKFDASLQETKYEVDTSSREFHDVCFGMRALSHRLNMLMQRTRRINADAALAKGEKPPEGFEPSSAQSQDSDAYYVKAPEKPGAKLKNFLDKLQLSCATLHEHMKDSCDSIMQQSKELDAAFHDKLPIAHDQLIRMEQALSTMVEKMGVREANIEATIQIAEAKRAER